MLWIAPFSGNGNGKLARGCSRLLEQIAKIIKMTLVCARLLARVAVPFAFELSGSHQGPLQKLRIETPEEKM